MPQSAVDELIPHGFIEAFVGAECISDEAPEVRNVLDTLDRDPRVMRVSYDAGDTYWTRGGADQPRHKPEGSFVVPFPPGVHVCMQYTVVLYVA